MKRGVLVAMAMVVVVSVMLQLGPQRAPRPGKGLHLSAMLPQKLAGWSGKDVPLGATEAATGMVEKTLRFDDVYFREFSSRGRTVSLYVAYWGPGKMPTQLVASHTPDRCWVENGWSCDDLKHDVSLISREAGLAPGEWRLFSTPAGQKLAVVFWHRIGDGFYDYGDRVNRVPSVWRWWRDAAKQVFGSPGEQYFVRLTSDQPFETLAGDPGWQQLTTALGQLGLRQPEAAPRP